MKKYSEILIFIFSFIFLNLNIKLVNSSIISNEGPNDITVYKAFGFILFGNEGFLNKDIENITSDGCIITFETTYPMYSHAFKRIYVKYDLNKAIWKSASSEEIEGKIFFILDGQIGTQSIKAINIETNDDVTNGLLIFGLLGGETSRIRFPILTDISRFKNALIDLSEICQGINTKH